MSDDMKPNPLQNLKAVAHMAEVSGLHIDDLRVMPAAGVADIVYEAKDRIEELEERLKAATDDAKEAEAYAEEIYAHAKELETKLERTSKMLPRALSAVYKDRKQEAIDVLETVIEQLTGGKDD